MDRMLAIPEDRHHLSAFRLCLLMALTALMLLMALPSDRPGAAKGQPRTAQQGPFVL